MGTYLHRNQLSLRYEKAWIADNEIPAEHGSILYYYNKHKLHSNYEVLTFDLKKERR